MRLTTIATRKALTVVAMATVALAVTCCGCVAFTTSTVPRAHAVDANYQLIQQPDAGYSPIIGLISGAARSVRMTMYELTDPAAVDALTDAHRRGADTKVILDAAFHGHETNAEAFQELSDAGVDVKWAPNGVIYHQKTITVDDTTAAVGTGNLTPQYYSTSRDAWVLDTNPTDVAAIAATFDTDYITAPSGRAPAATPAPNLIWSPAARASFLQHIDQAAHSVDVTSEELKDRAVLSALDKAARRGVQCRIVLPDNPAWANAVAEVSAAGCSVHLLRATNTALYMHEKMLLTDNTALIIGSQNLTTTSLLENRELSLALDATIAPEVVAAVGSTFDADYAAASAQ
ncbi:MAG TPA: phospholipase D-like domain-containing protein [Mycobacterium sp.]|nr:phospholipase D-like domain-containing protein [Mycobacterium sp.]HUH72364.1 phospholipase D-like domain-containing protein [Mycobacterium sp.]